MAENTFLGLQPYTEADAYRFKGRTEESQELFRLIVRYDYTVCYAESGEGKTSLLNAGVFPMLRQNMFFPIAITFTSDDYERTPDNFDTIIDRCIRDSIIEYNETNKGVNVEYKFCSTDFQDTDHQSALQQELSRYSWWKLRNYKPQAMGLAFTPVFVFDQFEEVFNLPGSIVWTKKFFDWLEDVSSDSCPEVIIQKVRSIIGDKTAFPDIKEEKDFKAVFSLRKEFIGELDYWGMQKCFIPSLKDNRYCLKALTYEGAKKVMTLQQRFEEAKVEQVLHYFVQQYSREPEKTIDENLPVIPALLLSVVCDSWEKDIDYFSDIDANGIDDPLNKILEKFYDEALSVIVNELTQQETNSQAESIHEDIETTIFALVDSNGKRVRRKSSELSHLDFDSKYKEILSDKRIIKISKIDGEDYVEVVHDSLCPIIAKRKETYLAAEAKRREEEKLREIAKKNRKRMMIASVIGLAIIGILLFFLWQNNRFLKEQKARSQSENENIIIRKSLNTSEEENANLKKANDSIESLNRINELQKEELNQSLTKQQELSQSLQLKNSELEKQMALSMKQQSELEMQLHINIIQADSLKKLLRTNERQLLSINLLQADSLHQRGRELVNEGKIAEGRECTRQAMEIRKKLLGEVSEDYITSLNNYAYSFGAEKNYVKAAELQEQVMELCGKLKQPHKNIGMYTTNMGRYYYLMGDKVKAAKMWEQALPLVEKYGEIYEFLLNSLGSVYSDAGDLQALSRIMALMEEHNQHELTKPCDEPKCMLERAQYFGTTGDNAKAKECYQKALAMKLEGEMAITVYEAYARFMVMTERDRLNGAEYQKKAALLRKKLKGEDGVFARSIYNAGLYYSFDMSEGGFGKAIDCYDQALETFTKLNDAQMIAKCQQMKGNAYGGLKDFSKAKECYKKALVYYEVNSKESDEYPKMIERVAAMEKFNKEYEASISHYRQAMQLFKQRGMMQEYDNAENGLKLCYVYAEKKYNGNH